jgi:hypothetical protein
VRGHLCPFCRGTPWNWPPTRSDGGVEVRTEEQRDREQPKRGQRDPHHGKTRLVSATAAKLREVKAVPPAEQGLKHDREECSRKNGAVISAIARDADAVETGRHRDGEERGGGPSNGIHDGAARELCRRVGGGALGEPLHPAKPDRQEGDERTADGEGHARGERQRSLLPPGA